MNALTDSTALALAAAGVVTLVTGLSFGTRWRMALPVSLELWFAAGLLRLAGEPSWARIATAAAIIGVRRVILSRVGAAASS